MLTPKEQIFLKSIMLEEKIYFAERFKKLLSAFEYLVVATEMRLLIFTVSIEPPIFSGFFSVKAVGQAEVPIAQISSISQFANKVQIGTNSGRMEYFEKRKSGAMNLVKTIGNLTAGRVKEMTPISFN